MHDFKWALEQIKAGKEVTRKVWVESGISRIMRAWGNWVIICFTVSDYPRVLPASISDIEAADWELYDPKCECEEAEAEEKFQFLKFSTLQEIDGHMNKNKDEIIESMKKGETLSIKISFEK